MSKSATSESARRAAQAAWQLIQASWVGGLWLLHLAIMPAIGKSGLAPLLVEEIHSRLSPLLLVIAVTAMLLQMLLLIWLEGVSALWRDSRGQLLLVGWALVVLYFGVFGQQLDAPRWLAFNYQMVALSGLLLVLQPTPGRSSRTVPN